MTDHSLQQDEIWPEELRLQDKGRRLSVTFSNGEIHNLDAEYLRVESPSAEVQGHGPGQKVCVAGKADATIIKIDPVGNYAVRLTFDDMHSTGIYSWDYLLKLGRVRESIWSAYVERLEREGKSRQR